MKHFYSILEIFLGMSLMLASGNHSTIVIIGFIVFLWGIYDCINPTNKE